MAHVSRSVPQEFLEPSFRKTSRLASVQGCREIGRYSGWDSKRVLGVFIFVRVSIVRFRVAFEPASTGETTSQMHPSETPYLLTLSKK